MSKNSNFNKFAGMAQTFFVNAHYEYDESDSQHGYEI